LLPDGKKRKTKGQSNPGRRKEPRRRRGPDRPEEKDAHEASFILGDRKADWTLKSFFLAKRKKYS
jgi:hypothetical protein